MVLLTDEQWDLLCSIPEPVGRSLPRFALQAAASQSAHDRSEAHKGTTARAPTSEECSNNNQDEESPVTSLMFNAEQVFLKTCMPKMLSLGRVDHDKHVSGDRQLISWCLPSRRLLRGYRLGSSLSHVFLQI
jgi:hypothetical protein